MSPTTSHLPAASDNRHPLIPFNSASVDVAAYAVLRAACLRHAFLPTFSHGLLLDIAMVAPDDEPALGAIRRLTHQEVRRFKIAEDDYDHTVAHLEAKRPPTPTASGENHDTPPRRPESWDFFQRTPREIALDLVAFAFAAGASDLLLDEQEEWMDVAIKIAGQKEILAPVERAHAASLLRAFKEIAGLSTQTVTTWQSGAASLPMPHGRRADLRIEITPTVHGESLVARIQDRQRQLDRMRCLPFTDPSQLALARACLRQSQGLIVATGPTGHGKTTTLYSCLGQLDRSVLNIRTLEDPVEFTVPWITQIPVGTDTGRSFADGLKSLLRQAPHVILMGEIRDGPVAHTCVEAVDTGHLIFATLHTRDAVGVVSRLLDLGLTGRQIATSLLLVVAQRLVRRLCPHCRKPVTPTPAQARHFAHYQLPVPTTLHTPGGCAQCGGQGERDVAAVFELLHPAASDDLTDAIGRASRHTFNETTLRKRWLALGGSSLVREALLLAGAGEISYAEVLKFERLPPFPDD
ncbi:MAG: Flp pilus assembly complex ATPase component TadA [Opitutaceae bacterium]|nr:Flp pilus assembly complex ATPase component TadA [Opitutaceae bacterium]